MPRLSVIIPTHNPHRGRLARTLAGLAAQTLPAADWETLLIDNASSPALSAATLPAPAPAHLRILPEPALGLTAARRCGLLAARGEICVLVDDDNVLAPTYLADAIRHFTAYPKLGAAGGPSRPEFETPPPDWTREFFPLLALRDLGSAPILAALERAPDGSHWLYPDAAPIGAGLALRRTAATAWLERISSTPALSDRRGSALTSGGDNDIVLTLLHAGWQVGYFPELTLTHLIPAARLTPNYLARLNRGIQTSWVQVLAQHGANPWPPISRWTVPLRQLRAWFRLRAWRAPAARIRWQGTCGHYDGRARCHTGS